MKSKVGHKDLWKLQYSCSKNEKLGDEGGAVGVRQSRKKGGIREICCRCHAELNCGTVGPAVHGQASVARPKVLDSETN